MKRGFKKGRSELDEEHNSENTLVEALHKIESHLGTLDSLAGSNEKRPCGQ